LVATPSQLPKPALQAPRVHAPATQAAVPPGVTQALLHRPQCATAVRVSTSQPLAGSPSQSAKPSLHSQAQAPSEQRAVVLGRLAQARPQPPQWAVVVAVLVSQPLAALMSQSPKEPVHKPTAQAPMEHTGAPLATLQIIPQPPQWAMLSCGSTQALSQQARPEGQGCEALQPGTHRLPEHTSPAGQWASVTHWTQRRVGSSQ